MGAPLLHYKTGTPTISYNKGINGANTERYSPKKKLLEISDERLSGVIVDIGTSATLHQVHPI